MSIHVELENSNQGVIITGSGTVNGADLTGKMKEIFSNEDMVVNYKYGINDFTQIEHFDILPSEIFALAKLHLDVSAINKDIWVGFAVADPLIYGLVRIWMAYAAATGWQLRIEKTFPEIRNWIDEMLAELQKRNKSELLGI